MWRAGFAIATLATGFVLVAAPNAYARCFYCDETGCHYYPGPCTGFAPSALAFQGTASIDCFGCGVSQGTAELTLTSLGFTGSAHADYTVTEGTGVTCVVTGSASGTTTGDVNVSFNWLRVGATAVITTTGDIDGVGLAGFVAHVSGLPCGAAITADVAGVVAGT